MRSPPQLGGVRGRCKRNFSPQITNNTEKRTCHRTNEGARGPPPHEKKRLKKGRQDVNVKSQRGKEGRGENASGRCRNELAAQVLERTTTAPTIDGCGETYTQRRGGPAIVELEEQRGGQSGREERWIMQRQNSFSTPNRVKKARGEREASLKARECWGPED